ncbi:MAG TPA: acyl-CoA dehydrogenase family protein [Cyclobacteriaceae bacterium]|nr:acyl-CoA dehydrogenase family protein [Cyclobacteriaceae bacterium]
MKTLLEKAAEIGPSLAVHIVDEESSRRPSEQTIKTLKENGFLKLFLPKSLGGLEVDPVTTAKIVETIALHNAGAAWSMMVSNISAWWSSMMPEKGVEEIYAGDEDVPLAGAFHPPMKAKRVKGGFAITGRSPLASNVSLAKWIFVTAFVTEHDQVKMNNGVPEMIGVVMNCRDCRIMDTWYTTGMRATDSNDVVAENVFVPDHLHHPLMPGLTHNRFYSSPLYCFSAIGASVACLIAPVALATARSAIQELKSLAEKKVPLGSMVSIRERGATQRKLGMAEALVQSSRAYLYETVSASWEKTLAGNMLSLDERANLLLAATHTNQSCCQAVDLVYSAAGSSALYTKNKINYHFSNAQVIRQHGFANDSRYETAAQVHFGLQPDLPVLAF